MLALIFLFLAIALASISQPSLECSEKLNPLFIKEIGKGAQGTVFSGPNNIVIKKIAKTAFPENQPVPAQLKKLPNLEKEVLEELNVLVKEGKATGFVKLIESIKCGDISQSFATEKFYISPSRPVDYTYLIMEKLDGTLNDELFEKTPSVDSYISYLAQTLTALDVAYKEKKFVSRDLHLNNIMTVKDFKTCSDSYGYYRYQMPDLTLDIPRSYSCGKNIKIIDVGLSAIDDKKGKRISYMKEGSIPKEHLADLFSVAFNFLYPNLEFFEKMKEKRPEVYEKLNNLYQHIFHPNQIPFIMAQYGLRKFFKVYKKFDIITWKLKYPGEVQVMAYLMMAIISKTYMMKNPWFTINDAIHHDLFKTMFAEKKGVDQEEITIIGKTEKTAKPYKPNYVRKFSHRLAYWYNKFFKKSKKPEKI